MSGVGLLYLQVPRISVVRFKVAATNLLLSYCQNKYKLQLQETGCFRKLRCGRKILRSRVFSRNGQYLETSSSILPSSAYICNYLITYITIIRNDIISCRCIIRVFPTLPFTFKFRRSVFQLIPSGYSDKYFLCFPNKIL